MPTVYITDISNVSVRRIVFSLEITESKFAFHPRTFGMTLAYFFNFIPENAFLMECQTSYFSFVCDTAFVVQTVECVATVQFDGFLDPCGAQEFVEILLVFAARW